MRTMFNLYEQLDNLDNGIKSVNIAKELDITRASVSVMLKKLAKKGYVECEPYSNVFLTRKGLREAKRVTHNHRVIEVFLEKILHCDQSNIHEEAHKLEHGFSEDSIKRLDKFLNHPTTSPYGKDIPH